MEPLRAADLAVLDELSWLPSDYVEWLHRHGFGEVAKEAGTYMLYSAPVQLSEFCTGAPQEAWTFGDDFSGYNACFIEGGDGTVHEWDSAFAEMRAIGKRFPEFIKKWHT